MTEKLHISEFLNLSCNFPVFDVRTPAEFNIGRIPCSFNLPLFTNEERAEVGTLYKQKGKEEAVLKGLKFVGPKMRTFVEDAKGVTSGKSLMFYCWRGGMRSSSMAWLFETVGFQTYTLVGGYKAYRKYLLDSFLKDANIIVLGGMTGSGKTEILQHLKEKGEQVIDLEKIAHHKGSSFGFIGETSQPSTEFFANLIFEEWKKFDLSKRIWIEDESHSVGKCFIPEELWTQMRKAPVIKLEIPKEQRVKRLVKSYTVENKEALLEATERIKKRLGGQYYNESILAIENSEFAKAAEIILSYYDKSYLHGLSKRTRESIFPLEFTTEDTAEIVKDLIQFADLNFLN